MKDKTEFKDAFEDLVNSLQGHLLSQVKLDAQIVKRLDELEKRIWRLENK